MIKSTVPHQIYVGARVQKMRPPHQQPCDSEKRVVWVADLPDVKLGSCTHYKNPQMAHVRKN